MLTYTRIFAGSLKMDSMNFLKPLSLAAFVMISSFTNAQLTNPDELNGRNSTLNTITTAVPFLMIAPDSRSGALGDAGAALSPDANCAFWNPAKLSFLEKDMEISMSYSPWLRALVNDMSLGYLSGAMRLNKNQGVGASLRFFTLGNITFTDESGSVIRDYKPSEYSVDMSFAQKLSDRYSIGIAGRYINSNLTGGTTVQGAQSKPGRSGAVDVGIFYTNDDLKLAGNDAMFNWGINVSNVGAKMRYTNTDERDFIPTNMKLGANLSLLLDDYNTVSFVADLNKLLVPTPPFYNPANPDSIMFGMDPDVGVATGIIQSFYDAPGNPEKNADGQLTGEVVPGSPFNEELRELNIGGGFEYLYAGQFAFRCGYFNEPATKGNRKFITLGAGLKYNVVTVDMSYLISTTQQNPLANTLRFTLRFEVGEKAKAEAEKNAEE